MNLLGAGSGGPQPGEVYFMPPDLYDRSDVGHPVLVLVRDEATRQAEVATRTTKDHARGPVSVPHQRDPNLGLSLFGWWRVHETRTHWVPFANFDDPAAELVGTLDPATWARVEDAIWPEETTP